MNTGKDGEMQLHNFYNDELTKQRMMCIDFFLLFLNSDTWWYIILYKMTKNLIV